ncbi:Plastoglobulin-1, chloroplastic [Mucuna pruriens]|uniref:Plastoglobulin-1, chloroplastic n=1 Tax=Mucuna pruriens TaxID=157652 RepID=A0A371DYT6_MUCPR|nr:Plastoglobulin-1, chloroplastic [Mucuna pruriens]
MAQISVSPYRHPVPMALLAVTSRAPFLFSQNPKPLSLSSLHSHLSLSLRSPRFPSLRSRSSATGDAGDAEKPVAKISDEWGEDYEPEASSSKLPDSDPPKDEDEWQERGAVDAGGYIDGGNGTPAAGAEAPAEDGVDDKLEGLKRALVDTVYGTELGIQAGSEVRAEVSELVTQLEAANPTLAPVEEPALLNGNWVLLYTSSSELLPLLAAGRLPLLKVDKITQTIDTSSLSIINSITFSSPFASLSFSASASFEVRSPARIQVTFKEGSIQPPEIKSKVELPENVDIFGQKLSLLPLQQSLGPLQNVVENISRVISGQPPLKIPIPGERTSSWLLTTYLDKDLRISRGDGGLFVLAREGSPLLDE